MINGSCAASARLQLLEQKYALGVRGTIHITYLG